MYIFLFRISLICIKIYRLERKKSYDFFPAGGGLSPRAASIVQKGLTMSFIYFKKGETWKD